MKFNSLTFDANLPTTQQVNVPTNTDYKVGMKVKRNGEVQQLGPDEITIYTGEVNVIPPTEYDSAAKNCSESIESILYNLDTTTATELSGQTVKATGVYIEISEDNGSTWQKKDPSGNVNLRVSDRSTGSNVYLYRTNLKNADRVWEIFDTDGTTVIGTTDTITVPQIGRFGTGSMLPTLFGDFTYPIQYRLVVNYGGGVEQITIPTDADKTNGYVTFTQASNDDASFRQLKVVVDTRVPSDQETVNAPTKTLNSITMNATTYLRSELSAFSGKRIYADTVKLQYSYDQETWTDVKYIGGLVPITLRSGTYTYIGATGHPSFPPNKWVKPGADSNWDLSNPYDYLEIPETDPRLIAQIYFQENGQSTTIPPVTEAPVYYRIQAKIGDPATGFTANFKLNVNEFKSQCGDLNAQTDPEFSTAKVEGTYADGTEFSFDFCVQ